MNTQTPAAKITGTVLWYDKRDGEGTIVDDAGNEYSVFASCLQNVVYLEAKDVVQFEINPGAFDDCGAHAWKVELLCDGENVCQGEGTCQQCCPHSDSRDHGICIDCGHEEDPGAAIDRAMDSMEDR